MLKLKWSGEPNIYLNKDWPFPVTTHQQRSSPHPGAINNKIKMKKKKNVLELKHDENKVSLLSLCALRLRSYTSCQDFSRRWPHHLLSNPTAILLPFHTSSYMTHLLFHFNRYSPRSSKVRHQYKRAANPNTKRSRLVPWPRILSVRADRLQGSGIKKPQIVRQSPRLLAKRQSPARSLSKSNHMRQVHANHPPTSNKYKSRKVCALYAPFTTSQTWSSPNTTSLADPSKKTRALSKTEARARRIGNRTSFSSNPRPASFEATTNLAFKLHFWCRTEEDDEKAEQEERKGERHQREERWLARILDPKECFEQHS